MPRAAPPGSRASPSAAATPVRRGMGKGRGEGRRVRGRGGAPPPRLAPGGGVAASGVCPSPRPALPATSLEVGPRVRGGLPRAGRGCLLLFSSYVNSSEVDCLMRIWFCLLSVHSLAFGLFAGACLLHVQIWLPQLQASHLHSDRKETGMVSESFLPEPFSLMRNRNSSQILPAELCLQFLAQTVPHGLPRSQKGESSPF